MGRTTSFGIAAAALLAACSGVDIRPISPALEREAHTRDGTASGYVVYGPMMVVEVTPREVCVAKNEKGTCTGTETRCAVGTPFALPDLAKPFLVDIKSGFGKSGVDLTIVNGWQLGGVKDTSDNTAILSLLEKVAVPLIRAERDTGTLRSECRAAGLYRVDIEGGSVRLAPLVAY
jgi:hypothetical protein